MKDDLEEVHWAALGLGATASVLSVPELLRGLLTETQAERRQAGGYWTVEHLLRLLWDEAGALRPGVPQVYRYLLEVLVQPQVVTRVDVLRCLFVWFDEQGGTGAVADEVRAVMRAGRPVYEALLREGDPELTPEVRELLAQAWWQEA
ncbi:hypothetical protein [Deinococcus koreensis]|uniref:Uncharacterized protein n=1 Tax=Deinococcus koreensis TaxID=2054903 RepID=A0A2K3US51_9DEIO|nr:hypothetical protein [Deinococcus koreensis]PNY79365.1 hypothetical protein CVO96_19770 [Deinococcus koreensis]